MRFIDRSCPKIANVSNRPKPTPLPVRAMRRGCTRSRHFYLSLFDERFDRLFQRRRLEWFDGDQQLFDFGQHFGSAGSIADPFVERSFVVLQFVVGQKEIGIVENVAEHF